MLVSVAKARKDIIAKLQVVPASKVGVFLAPVQELKHSPAGTTPKAAAGQPLDEETSRFLEQQDRVNKEQLEFFLKAHERHDLNLKKNMEFALSCLRKREEIDKMYAGQAMMIRREEERLKQLKDREERHVQECILKVQKNKQELERLRKHEEQVAEAKRKQLADLESELREKAKEKVKEVLGSIEHANALEESRKQTVSWLDAIREGRWNARRRSWKCRNNSGD